MAARQMEAGSRKPEVEFVSKKCRIREFLKPQIPIFPDRVGSWKIEAVLENQYRKWGFHQNLAKSVFDESGFSEKKGPKSALNFFAYFSTCFIILIIFVIWPETALKPIKTDPKQR